MHNSSFFSAKTDFFLLLALSMFVFPVQWVIGWLVAAAIHELFHIAMMCLLRVKIVSVTLSATGAMIEAGSLTALQECLCALAGPIGGLVALLFLRGMPQIALCAIIQSIYNLSPVYPFDGGRAIKCLLTSIWGESTGWRVARVISFTYALCLLVGGIWASLCYHPVVLIPVLILIIVTFKYFLQSKGNDSTITVRILNSERDYTDD